MRPTQSLDLSLSFAASLSPLWLLILLPLVLGLGFFLYYREIRRLSRRRVVILGLLRLTLLGLLLCCTFMPNLGVVRKRVFPGRILLLLDNSESMTVNDSSLPGPEAVALARSMNLDSSEPSEEDLSRIWFFQLSNGLRDVLVAARIYQRELATEHGSARRLKKADRTLADLATTLLLNRENQKKKAPLADLGTELIRDYEVFDRDLMELRRTIDKLSSAGRGTSSTLRQICIALEERIAECAVFQRHIDEGDLNNDRGESQTLARLATSAPRLELVGKIISELSAKTADQAHGQYLQRLDMIGDGKPVLMKPSGASDTKMVRGRTLITQRLREIIEDPSEFPLTGVILVSDGVDLDSSGVGDVLEHYIDRHVPIFSAGVGHRNEPYDLAIAQVMAPPLGIKDHRIWVEVQVKAEVRTSTVARVVISLADKEIATKEFKIKRKRQAVYVSVTPTALGLQHYTVKLSSTASDDVFKERNNSSEFVLDVRSEKVRVLLLDDRPRWQTRFVLNALGRLAYVDVNSMVRAVQDDGVLKRGMVEGTWPRTPELLSRYDMIIMGRLNVDVLTNEEWKQVANFVQDEGKTLAFLGPIDRKAVPTFIADLLPRLTELGSSGEDLTANSLSDLRLTGEGALHPLTRALEPHLAKGRYPSKEQPSESLILLHDASSGRPVVSFRFAGHGKVFALHSQDLWACLNSRHLVEHGAVFVNLVNWAVGSVGTDLVLDQNVLGEDESFQVWQHEARGKVSVFDQADSLVVRADVDASQDLPTVGRAVFQGLVPGHFSVKVKPSDAGQPLFVLADNEEVVTLAQQEDYMRRLASVTGGSYAPFYHLSTFLPGMDLKDRVEVHRYILPLWRSWMTLLFLISLLTCEWVLRKYWSLV